MTNLLLTDRQLAAQCNVSRSLVWVWVKLGKLKPVKCGRCTRFKASEVAALFTEVSKLPHCPKKSASYCESWGKTRKRRAASLNQP